MENKQRFLIYDRKEMLVLIILGIMVMVFSFTLGVHLGKRLGPKYGANGLVDTNPASTNNDQLPNRQEFTEQSKGVYQAIDESLNRVLHDEVARTGVKLDTPVQVDLPEKTRAEVAKKTPARAEPKTKLQASIDKVIPAVMRPSGGGKYTLQVGSYQTAQEAQSQADALDAQGLKPYLRTAELKNKGKWYRIYVGGYDSREEAERAGNNLKARASITSYIITNQVE